MINLTMIFKLCSMALFTAFQKNHAWSFSEKEE